MRFDQGHALVIGVGADLPNTVDDAQGLADILKDEERCAYPPEQVHTLTGANTTREATLAALDELARSTDPKSTVLIYFSGHGYQVSSSSGDAYFLLPFGYDVKRLKATAISGAEFAEKLRAIPAQKLLVLLDCCHAGGVGDAKTLGMEFTKSPLPPETTNMLAEGRGRVFIASSQENELSFAGKPFSAFTLALIEVLSGEEGLGEQPVAAQRLRAEALIQLNRTAEATRAWERALEQDPGRPQVRFNLSTAYRRIGRLAELVGGVILCGLGLRILITHLWS